MVASALIPSNIPKVPPTSNRSTWALRPSSTLRRYTILSSVDFPPSPPTVDVVEETTSTIAPSSLRPCITSPSRTLLACETVVASERNLSLG
ncbi:hypothetical protein ACHAXA_004201 [Cyclostephanos tholiformis]|uniref:Uncharacterized protein n=1 Tax=Cyclostephanos tholiformis TaxID=382380 RepID=A0ABD3RC40_9STRA